MLKIPLTAPVFRRSIRHSNAREVTLRSPPGSLCLRPRPEGYAGQHNPQVEGGGITNLADYAKLLHVHLNGGYCGETQVLSEESLASMREDRGSFTLNPTPYGMGWWISSDAPGIYTDGGAFGAVSFLDLNTGIGGFIAIDDYTRRDPGAPSAFLSQIALPLIQEAVRARYE